MVDLEAAAKLGKVKEIIVQEDGERVAGFVVSHSETILGTGGTRRNIPAAALHAIGPDAITVRGSAITDGPQLDALPRLSDVIGHKMVTQSGRLLGTIDDILLEPKDGMIIGFLVGEGMKSKLENIFSPERAHSAGYVRANAELQVGNDLIVVPDDAFVAGDPAALAETAGAPATSPAWTGESRTTSARRNLWTKRTPADGASTSSDEVEGWIPGDFSPAATSETSRAEAAATAPPLFKPE